VNCFTRSCLLIGSAAVTWVALCGPGAAQIDLSGSWAARNSTEALENPPGVEPGPVDYAGIPLNRYGRAAALLTSDLQLSEPERICSFYPPSYLMLGPFGLKIWNQTEPRNGVTVAWHIGGWEDRAPMTIWMDGRASPSSDAAHPMAGFAVGQWQDDVLRVQLTDMKVGISRRNLAPLSDEHTMTAWFLRHGDELTVFARIVDPIYLSQPLLLTRAFVLVRAPVFPSVGQPCTQTDEGVAEGAVPFYFPGKNPNLDYMTKQYGIPRDAVLGGAETMFPEFHQKLRSRYVRPKACRSGCGGPGQYPRPRGPA
jgi:hypothetical protein